MHQQIVYTRCKPRRELSTGKVINEAGFGIHNFSQNILLSEYMDDPQFIEEIWKKHNAAKEKGSNSTGLFYSYQYFYRATGKSIMVQEYLRPYNPSEVRTNGQDNRPGNYIKQYLIGDLEGYPCLLFGASCWDASVMSENSYYHDSGEPLDYLPEVTLKYKSIETFQNEVRKFIQDGRETCVKKLVATIAAEMVKPLENRRFIVIKDFPENVELWLSALELAFPLYLAEQISFSTNVVASVDLAIDNTFYRDGKGKYMDLNQREAIIAGGEKAHFFMLMGIHPTARGSAEIVFGKNCAEYIVLDGELKDIEAADVVNVAVPYYEAVTQMNEDIRDFNMLLSELAQLHFDNQFHDLYELFDAYKYLLDSESSPEIWSYDKVKKYLLVFKKYEKAPFRWSQYLSEKIYGIYSQFYDMDCSSGFALLKLIISMDHSKKLQSIIEQFLLDKYMYELKTRSVQVKQVSELYNNICSMYPSMIDRMCEEFKANIPVFMDYIAYWNQDQAYFMFSTLFKFCNSNGSAVVDWYKDVNCEKLIDALLHQIWDSDKKTIEILIYVKHSPLYLDFVLKGIRHNYNAWIGYICETVDDSKLDLVCGLVLDYDNITLKLYEEFLIGLLNKNKSSLVLFKFLLKAMDKCGVTTDAIDAFVVSFLKKYKQKPSELTYLMRIISDNDLGRSTEMFVYDNVQEYLENALGEHDVYLLALEFEKWRVTAKKKIGRAYTLVFAYELEHASADTIDTVLDRYSEQESIIVNETDLKMITKALGKHINSDKILVKIYHVVGQSDFHIRKNLLAINIDDVELVKRFIQLTDLTGSFEAESWKRKYKLTIKAVSEDFYQLIKDANIDKLEKCVLKSLMKKDPYVDGYKQFFVTLKERIKEEKETEKIEQKMSKKESPAHSEGDKKGLFSKLFGKK